MRSIVKNWQASTPARIRGHIYIIWLWPKDASRNNWSFTLNTGSARGQLRFPESLTEPRWAHFYNNKVGWAGVNTTTTANIPIDQMCSTSWAGQETPVIRQTGISFDRQSPTANWPYIPRNQLDTRWSFKPSSLRICQVGAEKSVCHSRLLVWAFFFHDLFVLLFLKLFEIQRGWNWLNFSGHVHLSWDEE